MAIGPYVICDNPPHHLTAVELADIPEIVRVLNINKDVYNGTGSFQYPYTEEYALARINRAHGYITDKGYNTHWAMRTSPDGPLIGWIHVYFNQDKDEVHPETDRPLKIADIGYWVSPEYVCQGYGSRSAKFVVNEILFKTFDIDIVRGEAYTHNKASIKVLKSAGMFCEVEEMTVFIPKFQEQRVISAFAAHRDMSTKSVVTKPHN
ncbi:hypothetical protein EDD11_000643 [Mortierella claussenii]|nr:hypothetical protein EDD11_000643 [Mortierella claussenii]